MSRLREFDIHPIAEAFPLIEGEKFEQLCDSVKKHGIMSRIVLHDGKVIDGRNRIRAAMNRSVEQMV